MEPSPQSLQEVGRWRSRLYYKVPAMSADQYRQSWVGGPPVAPPAWLIFHAGIGEDTSFFTVTVWESRAAYDAFAPVFAHRMKERGFEFGERRFLPFTTSFRLSPREMDTFARLRSLQPRTLPRQYRQ